MRSVHLLRLKAPDIIGEIMRFRVLVFLIIMLLSVQGAAAWDSDFGFRKSLTLNASAENLTDYQVKKTIAYNVNMQADFDDLRFTTLDGTNIPYWVESYTASTSAVVWLKVPSITTTSGAQIWMYYGNSSVNSASSISNTGLSYSDDFNRANGAPGSNWQVVGNSAQSGINSNALKIVQDGAYNDGYSSTGIISTSDGLIVMVRGKHDSPGTTYGVATGIVLTATAPSTSSSYSLSTPTGLRFRRQSDSSNAHESTIAGTSTTFSTSQITDYEIFEVLTHPTDGTTIKSDGVTIQTGAGVSLNAYIVFAGNFGNYGHIDWCFVRKYTATEPTWAADGEEQPYFLNPDINTTLSAPINTYTSNNNFTFNIAGNFSSANATLYIDAIEKWNGSITTGLNTAYNIILTEGLHSWYINATATVSGNTTSNVSSSASFYYDISDPTVTTANINPSYSIISEGSIVNMNLSWSDNLQLKNGTFYVNTGSGYSETDNTTLSGTSDWFNTSIDTSGLSGHSVSWYQIAYDQAGNSFNYSGSYSVVLGALSIHVFDETTGDPVLPSDVKVYNDDISRTASINGSTNISSINYDGFTSGKYIVSIIADDYYTRRSIVQIDIETLSSLNIYLPSENETTIFDQFVLVDNTLMHELSECIIRLDKPLPNGTDTVYSSYFDFDGVASTYLIATDQYILYIETPTSVISYGWLTPDADGQINIVITDPITDVLDDWLSYSVTKLDTGSITLNYESDIDIDTASFYLNTSAGAVLYTASISTDSGSFTYSADVNESYYLSFTATSQSGDIKTVTRFIFWNEGGIQPERLPLLPDGAPDWFYNLLSVGVIIICVLLFSQVRADAACIIGASFSGLFWYWGWLKISGVVIAVIALIAIAAVMYKSKREGI